MKRGPRGPRLWGARTLPDRRSHRGADPRDAEAFGASSRPALCSAVRDLSWLLSRGYAPTSSLKLVGDRWGLTERQRMAVRRSACADDDRARRALARVDRADLAGGILWVDGFNVLTTVESHLGGGVVLRCRDGTFRDLAGVHGTYRRVVETSSALRAIGAWLGESSVAEVRWLFDRPVSNSGRIASLVRDMAAERGLAWSVELANNPDRVLADSVDIVATADSGILDAGPRWYNLARKVIESLGGVERVVDLSGD